MVWEGRVAAAPLPESDGSTNPLGISRKRCPGRRAHDRSPEEDQRVLPRVRVVVGPHRHGEEAEALVERLSRPVAAAYLQIYGFRPPTRPLLQGPGEQETA